MSRYQSYLNSAKRILSLYKGEEPFTSFSKRYFAANKKYGSADRRQINHLCYCYFRTASLFSKGVESGLSSPGDLQLLQSLFLCSTGSNAILASLKPAWNEKLDLPVAQKLSHIGHPVSLRDIFPWKEELSDEIDHEKFCGSFLIQPDLFLRIRPGHAEHVLLKLKESGTAYEFISPFAIRLPNNFKVENYFQLNKEVVVQDLSSQRVGEFFSFVRRGPSGKLWDCCAGSGGKSIMAYDLFPEIDLTVSDVRESILINLKKRFKEAGIRKYQSFTADISKSPLSNSLRFDNIICDIPCTGSGTWSRTPEQLAYVDKKKIGEYGALQKKIVSNVIPHLDPGGHFFYITCSVFKKENEEVVDFIKKQPDLQLIRMELLKGYDHKADTMFAALFQKL